MTKDAARVKFLSLLDESKVRCIKFANRHSWGAVACYVLAITASGLTTLVTAFDALPRSWTAALAAFPALALLFNNVLRFDAKSN
jgi:hypothetical protein